MKAIMQLPKAPYASRVAVGKRLAEEAQSDPRIWALSAREPIFVFRQRNSYLISHTS